MRGNVLNTLLQVCLQDLNWLQYLVSYCLYYVLKDKTSENSAKKGAYLNAYFWHFWTLAPLLKRATYLFQDKKQRDSISCRERKKIKRNRHNQESTRDWKSKMPRVHWTRELPWCWLGWEICWDDLEDLGKCLHGSWWRWSSLMRFSEPWYSPYSYTAHPWGITPTNWELGELCMLLIMQIRTT